MAEAERRQWRDSADSSGAIISARVCLRARTKCSERPRASLCGRILRAPHVTRIICSP